MSFEELYQTAQPPEIGWIFLQELAKADKALGEQLEAARRDPEALAPKQHSELMIAVAPYAEDFIGQLFGIGKELERSSGQALSARASLLC